MYIVRPLYNFFTAARSMRMEAKKGSENMNMAAVTLEDCIDMYEKKGKETVINDGAVVCFIEK